MLGRSKALIGALTGLSLTACGRSQEAAAGAAVRQDSLVLRGGASVVYVVPDTSTHVVPVGRPEAALGPLLADSGMMRLPEVQAKMNEYNVLHRRGDMPRDEAMERLYRWVTAYRAANPERLAKLRAAPPGVPVR